MRVIVIPILWARQILYHDSPRLSIDVIRVLSSNLDEEIILHRHMRCFYVFQTPLARIMSVRAEGVHIDAITGMKYSESADLHCAWFEEREHSSQTVDSPHKEPVLRTFGVVFHVGPHKLLSKHSICRWFEAPWRPCGMTVMMNRLCSAVCARVSVL